MPDLLTIREVGQPQSHPYAGSLKKSFERALVSDQKLPDFVLDMLGMSGRRYRSTINNLIESFEDPRYLEIGSWGGSTCCAAIYGNAVTATCIDNWSLFGGPKAKFLANTAKCKGPKASMEIIESDFRQVNFSKIGRYNIYLFDGPHEWQDQLDGVVMAQPALDDVHVLVVDDWNWSQVREGTFEGIKRSSLDVLYSIEVRTTQDDSLPTARREKSDWHNGYFMSVVHKAGRRAGGTEEAPAPL